MENNDKYYELLGDVKSKLYDACEEYVNEQYQYRLLLKMGEKSLADALKEDSYSKRSQVSLLDNILKEQNVDTTNIKIKAAVSGYKKYLIKFNGLKEEELE